MLRSQLCLQQMLQRTSGGNHPAIAQDELAQVLIPVPSPTVQESIAAEMNVRRDEAHRLRTEAAVEWEAAKARFEARLLGG